MNHVWHYFLMLMHVSGFMAIGLYSSWQVAAGVLLMIVSMEMRKEEHET